MQCPSVPVAEHPFLQRSNRFQGNCRQPFTTQVLSLSQDLLCLLPDGAFQGRIKDTIPAHYYRDTVDYMINNPSQTGRAVNQSPTCLYNGQFWIPYTPPLKDGSQVVLTTDTTYLQDQNNIADSLQLQAGFRPHFSAPMTELSFPDTVINSVKAHARDISTTFVCKRDITRVVVFDYP